MTVISTGSAPNARDDIDGLEQRRPARHGVLGDHDAIAGLQGAGDAPDDAVILGLLAHREAAQLAATRRRHGGDAVGDRIGTDRQPADRRGVVGDDLEGGLGDEQDAVGTARRLLGVDEPGAVRTRLEREVATLHRVVEHVVAQGGSSRRQRWEVDISAMGIDRTACP